MGWQRELEREDPRFLSTIMGSPFSVWFCWAFVLRLLDDLNAPFPEFVDFAHSFRRLAEEIIERRAHREEMAISVRHIQPHAGPGREPERALDGVRLFSCLINDRPER